MKNVNGDIKALTGKVESRFRGSLAARRQADGMADFLFLANASAIESLARLGADNSICAEAHGRAIENLRDAAWILRDMSLESRKEERNAQLRLMNLAERELGGAYNASMKRMTAFWRKALPLLDAYPMLDLAFQGQAAKRPGMFSIWKAHDEDMACASIEIEKTVREITDIEGGNFYDAARESVLRILPNLEPGPMRHGESCRPGDDFLPIQIMNIAIRNMDDDEMPEWAPARRTLSLLDEEALEARSPRSDAGPTPAG